MGYIPNKLVKAEKRITAYPYDTEAWSALIRDAQVIPLIPDKTSFPLLPLFFNSLGQLM